MAEGLSELVPPEASIPLAFQKGNLRFIWLAGRLAMPSLMKIG
jgi:hypothetical protein